jgi:uncharacterized protein
MAISMSNKRETIFERTGEALGVFVTGNRLVTTLISLVLCLAFASGITRARFSTDYRIFFSKEDPGLAAFKKLESVFSKTDNVLLVVHAKNGSVFTQETLSVVQELTERSWKIPYASRVDSLTNYQNASAAGDDIVVSELVKKPAQTLSDAELIEAQRIATNEPILLGSLLAKDLQTTAVNVTIQLPGSTPEEVTESAAAARALVSELEAKHPNLKIRPSGMAFMNDAFMQASVRDLSVMMPIMVAIMLLGMFFVMRSAWATASVGLIIGLSAALTMAFAGWLKYPLSPPCVAAPMIVLTVAVADGVHVVLAVMDGMRAGLSKQKAITASLRHNLEAITYTWLTTIVGFICLNYSEAPPVRHLANMTCFGVTIAFVYSFTLLPALLALLPVRATAKAAANSESGMSGVMVRLANFVMMHRNAVLASAAVLTVCAGVLASQLETNDQFVKYFDTSIPFRRDADFTMKHLSGIYRLEFQVGSEGEQGISDPSYLATLEAFENYLRAQSEVDHVYGLADIQKRIHQVMNSDDPSAYRVPSVRETAAENLLVYEMSLPPGLDLKDRINVNKSASRVSVTVRDLSTKQMSAFSHRAEQWLRDHAAKSMWSEATGPVVIFSALSDRNAKSMVQGDFLSLALISLCMIVVLRNFKLGLLSILPNVIPIVVGYGLWKLCVGQMNIVASVAGSISLGIIVDDTIHFLTKYKNTQQEFNLSPEDAMRKTLSHVGPAMIGTSAILVLGFGVLCFSSFQMTSYLGWLSVIIVSIAPLVDLVLAPALVVAFASAFFSGSKKRTLQTLHAGMS